MQPKQQQEYYSKFLTSEKSKNQTKLMSSSAPKDNENNQNNLIESQEVNEDYIQFNNMQQGQGLEQAQMPSDLSQITYGLFVNQTKERLFKTFFKNQQDNIAIQTKKLTKSPKMNQLKTQKKEEAKQISKKEEKAKTEQKKKEYYEEIIKANRECIRVNPFLSQNDGNERKFEIENLNTDKVVEIEIENEVQIKREQTEQRHREILTAKIPEIFEKIRLSEKDKYFIKNKYQEALAKFEE